MLTIKTTCEIVTEESAEEGEYAYQGWEDEEGEQFDSPEEAASFILDQGPVEHSCCPDYDPHGWYRQIDETGDHHDEIDYEWGVKLLSFHPQGPEDEKRKLWQLITKE